jgi:hypothetical protein
MTKGELIVACIKTMFDNDIEQLDPLTISENLDYASRTVNIIECINRAFDEIAKAKKLPKKTLLLVEGLGNVGDYYTKFDLNEIIGEDEVLYITNVAYENRANYDQNIEIKIEGENTLVLPNIKEGRYIVTYHPKYTKQLSYDDPDSKEIEDMPAEALRVIPYFVKAELYEDDDASRATLARNIFHQYLAEIPKTPHLKQTKVKSVFSGL